MRGRRRRYRGRRLRPREPEDVLVAVFVAGLLAALALGLRATADICGVPVEDQLRYAMTLAEPAAAVPEAPAPAEPPHTLADCRITHYCACAVCCGKWADGVTATGAVPEEGVTVAVDPAVIPLGSTVYIDGQAYLAQDTGVRGAAVDVYMADHRRALEAGTYTAEVAWRQSNLNNEEATIPYASEDHAA